MIPSEGYSLCYYSFYAFKQVMTESFAQHESVTTCVRLRDPINFYENYNKDKVHRWPGLTEKVGNDYFVKLTGYFKAAATGVYAFQLNNTNHASLVIDDKEWLSVGTLGQSYSNRSVNGTLEEGMHLLSVYYSYSDLESALHVQWKREQGEWQTLDASTLCFGSVDRSL